MNCHALRPLGTSPAGMEPNTLSVRSRYSAVLGDSRKNFVKVQVSQKETSQLMLNFILTKSTKTVKLPQKMSIQLFSQLQLTSSGNFLCYFVSALPFNTYRNEKSHNILSKN